MASQLAFQTVVDALARCRSLLEEAQALQAQYFRSPVPLRAAQLIERVAQQACLAIEAEWDDYVQTSSSFSLQAIGTWDDLVRMGGYHLRYLRGSTADRVPGTFSRALDSLSAKLGVSIQVLLREKWHYNYAVQADPLTETYRRYLAAALMDSDKADELLKDLGPPIYAIAFPAIERDSVLLHAALGHELGHLLASDFLHQDQGDPSVGNAIKSKSHEVNQGAVAPLLAFNETVEQMTYARKRMLEEYFADVIAIELFGPAALFTMASVALSALSDIDKPPSRYSDYYPSWRQRLRRATEHLKQTAWWPLTFANENANRENFQAVRDRVDQIEAVATAQPPASVVHPIVDAAHELAQSHIAVFRTHAQTVILQNYPSRRTLLADSEVATFRLVKRLPPNDVGSRALEPKYPALASILNAGWFYRIGWIERGQDLSAEWREQLCVAQRLVSKAVEDTILCADYVEWRAAAVQGGE